MPAYSSPLILASASPRRQELLQQIGVPFKVAVAEVVENESPDHDPRALVAGNAALKANAIANRNPESWVLGADTTVCVAGEVLNKPADLPFGFHRTGSAARRTSDPRRSHRGESGRIPGANRRPDRPLPQLGAHPRQGGRLRDPRAWRSSRSAL